jgi:putative transcriptional regulator
MGHPVGVSSDRRASSVVGKLLIAEPMLGDPNFERSVVLMIEHVDEGALGGCSTGPPS